MRRSFALAGAIFVAAALQGCAQLQNFPGGGANDCATTHGLCQVWIDVPDGCTDGTCVVVKPDPVHVGDGTGSAKDVNLLWRLPQGYAFCNGDGITFKPGPGSQFSDPYSTDDPRGGRGTSNGIKKNFHWKDANTAKGTFAYGIRFHAQSCSGAMFYKDPDVVNDM
jgi:hypothetical protein